MVADFLPHYITKFHFDTEFKFCYFSKSVLPAILDIASEMYVNSAYGKSCLGLTSFLSCECVRVAWGGGIALRSNRRFKRGSS